MFEDARRFSGRTWRSVLIVDDRPTRSTVSSGHTHWLQSTRRHRDDPHRAQTRLLRLPPFRRPHRRTACEPWRRAMHRSLSVAFSSLSRPLRCLVGLAIIGSALSAGRAAADGWPVAHGNPANTSHQNIVTAPAISPLRVIDDLGTFADGI